MWGYTPMESWSRLTGKVIVLQVKRCAVCDSPIAGAMSVCADCLDRAMRGQFDRMERDFPTDQVGFLVHDSYPVHDSRTAEVGHQTGANPTAEVGDKDLSVVRSGIVYSVPKLPSVKKLTLPDPRKP